MRITAVPIAILESVIQIKKYIYNSNKKPNYRIIQLQTYWNLTHCRHIALYHIVDTLALYHLVDSLHFITL